MFFILYSEKSDYVSNSQLTNTSQRLCQHLKFNPEKYEDRRNLGSLANKLDRVSQELSNTFTRSVTFNERTLGRPSMEQIIRIDHLYDREFPEAKLSQFTPSMSKSEKSRLCRPDDYTMIERRDYPLATYESLAKKYYPVTFSAVLEEDKLKDQLSRSQCMTAPSSGKKHAYTRAKSALQRLRQSAVDEKYQKYTRNSSNFHVKERGNEEKMYSLSSEAPTIGTCQYALPVPRAIKLRQAHFGSKSHFYSKYTLQKSETYRSKVSLSKFYGPGARCRIAYFAVFVVNINPLMCTCYCQLVSLCNIFFYNVQVF